MTDGSTACLVFEDVGLKASVGSHYLLRNISFRLQRGDRLALVGPSGAGKTSILRLINRLTECSDGSIYLNSQDIRRIPIAKLRASVLLVLQESKLLGMTVRETLTYPLLLRHLDPFVIHQRLEKWTSRLNIPQDWMERTEVQLSVGQRQLVAIARALVTEPSLLLLDEPTSALDVGRSDTILQIFHMLSQNDGMTIIMANHDLAFAEQFCTQVLVLEDGRAVIYADQSTANWHQIRDKITQAELQSTQEWGGAED